MNEQINKNGQLAVHETQRLNKELITITGILTSKIEERTKGQGTYYYSFFKFPDQEQKTLVIFKIRTNEGFLKPDISRASTVSLIGRWTKPLENNSRPSFTCYGYDVVGEPEPLTLTSLQKEISVLLKPSLDKKQDWTETTDFLFKKLDELKKITQLSQLGPTYLKAYFLTENARYANYQAEHLPQANFNLESYLDRIASELDLAKRQMLAAGWKETKQ